MPNNSLKNVKLKIIDSYKRIILSLAAAGGPNKDAALMPARRSRLTGRDRVTGLTHLMRIFRPSGRIPLSLTVV